MRDVLFDYQKKIFDDEKNNNSNALFMDMGTGKTITSIALMNEKPVHKILVICLVSKVDDWVDEFDNYLGKKLIKLRSGTARNKSLLDSDCDGFVVNFESLWRLDKDLLSMIDNTWGIIVDESQMIKNSTSKVTKYALQLGKKTPYKIILTGTPQSQGYVDYYTQFKFLGKWDMTMKDFERNYCVMGHQYYGKYKIKVIESYKNTDELDDIISSDAVYYRAEVDDDMIPKDNFILLPAHSSYKKFKNDRVLTHKGKFYLGDSMGAYYMGLRTLSSGFIKDYITPTNSKIQWVSDLLLSYDERIVIFYNFNKELNMLKELLTKSKRPYSEYNGDVKDLENFKNKNNGVVLVNYGSGSTGINDLVVSQIAVFYSPPIDTITYQQARKRIDRIGQIGKPRYYNLCSKDTVEEKIYDAVINGKDFDDKMFMLTYDL